MDMIIFKYRYLKCNYFLLSEYFFQARHVFKSVCFTISVAFAFPSDCVRITRIYLEMTR